MKPDLGRKIESKQNNQKATQDAHSTDRNFQVNETVLVQNFRGEPKWMEAVIIERTGPVSYTVQIGKEIAKRHVDQILSRKDSGNSKRVIYNADCCEDYMILLGSNQVSSGQLMMMMARHAARHQLTMRVLISHVIQLE